MIKQVLQDMYSARREGLKEAKQVLWVNWFTGIIAANSLTNAYRNWMDAEERDFQLCFSMTILYLFAAAFFHSMYSNRLAKPMFFVAVGEREKQQYLKTAYFVKTVLVGGVYFLLFGVLCIRGHMNFLHLLFSTVSVSLWSLVIGLQNWYGQFNLLREDGNFNSSINPSIKEWVAKNYSVFVCVIYLPVFGDTEKVEFFFINFLVMFLQVVLCRYVIKSDYKNQMAEAQNWELYCMKRKEENNI